MASLNSQSQAEYAGSEEDYLEYHVQQDENLTLSDVLRETIQGRTQPTVKRFVMFSYLKDAGMPPRYPARKELTIKQVYINPPGSNEVNKTCDALLSDTTIASNLDKIIIAEIQSEGWKNSLQRNGWTILEGEGPPNAEKKRTKEGGRKIIENKNLRRLNTKRKKKRKKRRTRRL